MILLVTALSAISQIAGSDLTQVCVVIATALCIHLVLVARLQKRGYEDFITSAQNTTISWSMKRGVLFGRVISSEDTSPKRDPSHGWREVISAAVYE